MSDAVREDDSDPELDADPIIESSTLSDARVTFKAHPVQKVLEVETPAIETDLIVTTCTLNGVEYHNPDQPLVLEDVTVTYNPREQTAAVRTY